MWEFLNTVDSLRDLLDDVAPMVLESDRAGNWRELLTETTKELTARRRQAITQKLESFAEILTSSEFAVALENQKKVAARAPGEADSEQSAHW